MKKTKNKNNSDWIDKLKEYFENTPREQVLLDWDKSKEWDNVGIKCEDFLSHLNKTLKETENNNVI